MTTKNAPQLSRVPLLRIVIIEHVIDTELLAIMRPLQGIDVLGNDLESLIGFIRSRSFLWLDQRSKDPLLKRDIYVATFLIKNSRGSSRLFWVTCSQRKRVLWKPKINIINWKAFSFWNYRLMNWGGNILGNFFGFPQSGTWEFSVVA